MLHARLFFDKQRTYPIEEDDFSRDNYSCMSFVPLKESIGETSVLASRFIVLLIPFKNIEEFPQIYQDIKTRFPKADHYPYAYKVGGKMKSSDDGEPGGAAGRPFLTLLDRKNIDQALLVAVRYFGGSKLGLPRLTRTFSSTAELALSSASLGEEVVLRKHKITLSYHDYESLKSFARRREIKIENEEFGASVTLETYSGATIIDDLTSASIKIEAYEDLGDVITIKEI